MTAKQAIMQEGEKDKHRIDVCALIQQRTGNARTATACIRYAEHARESYSVIMFKKNKMRMCMCI